MNARMLDNFETVYEVGGKTAIVGTIALAGWNYFAKYMSFEYVNPLLITVTGIISLIYMISKLQGQRLTNKQKRMEIRQLERMEELRKKREESNEQS